MQDMLLKLMVMRDIIKWRAGCRIKLGLSRFHQNESGAGAAEYAVVTGVAVILGIGILKLFWGSYDDGEGIGGVFKKIVTFLSDSFDTKATELAPE